MTEKTEKPKTVEDYFNDVFAEIKAMKEDFGKVIKEDRAAIDKITTTVNQLNSAVAAANSARDIEPKGPSNKRGLKLGAGAQGFISMLTSLGKSIMANPDKYFGSPPPTEQYPKLQKRLVKTALENSIKRDNLLTEKLEKEVERIGKTGWSLR